MITSPLRGARRCLAGLGVLFLAVVSMLGASLGASQKPVTMQDLTVPRERLPSGCSLKVIAPVRPEVVPGSGPGRETVRFNGPAPSMQPDGITANPWIGTDRKVLTWLRGRIDGQGRLRVPDAPPSIKEESALRSQLANGVEEGYAATYAQLGAQDLGVQAVRFTVTPAPRFDVLDREQKNTVHVEIGSTWIVFYRDGGQCSTAIEAHLKSIG